MLLNPSYWHGLVRAQTGTTLTYEGDWHALFTQAGIASGTFNERLLQYVNNTLGETYETVDGAVAALVENGELGGTAFAPVLTWDADSSDASPDFTAVFDFRASGGDEVTLEFASDEEFTTDVATYTHEITAGEIAGDTLSITVTDLADGTWYARLKHKLTGGTYSDWSNIELITVQTSVDSLFLMEDGASFYLMEDGVSKYLLE